MRKGPNLSRLISSAAGRVLSSCLRSQKRQEKDIKDARDEAEKAIRDLAVEMGSISLKLA
jgi:hypothetical protein